MSIQLVAEVRTDSGKGAARRLRRANLIPGVVYAKGKSQAVTVSPKELSKILLGSHRRNTVIELDVQEGGSSKEKSLVMVKDLQKDPIRRNALHVDFIKVSKDVEVTASVPFLTTGRSQAVVQGGKLQVPARFLRIRCFPQNIPENITLDITEVGFGAFRAGSVQMPEGVTLVEDPHATVLTIKAPRGKKAASEEEAAEG